MFYKNSMLLVSAGSLGIYDREAEYSGYNPNPLFFGHPFLRKNWQISDRFRGAQGYYYTSVTSRMGAGLVNYGKKSGEMLRPLEVPAVSGPWYGTSTRVNRFTDSSFTIYPNNSQWNSANPRGWDADKPFNDFLIENVEVDEQMSFIEQFRNRGSTTISRGIPNFYLYVASNPGAPAVLEAQREVNPDEVRLAYSDQQAISDAEGKLSSLFAGGEEYVDHVTKFRYPSRNKVILAKSGYNVGVKSYYNFYSEHYEPASTDAGFGVELMLPNLYMLESDIHNTGSVIYVKQLTLDQGAWRWPSRERIWFFAHNRKSGQGAESYFKLFGKRLKELVAEPERLSHTKTTFTEKYRNVVTLYADRDILRKYDIRDDRGTYDSSDDVKATAFYPFYNEIVIGVNAEDCVGLNGTAGALSLFTLLRGSSLPEHKVASLITALELYIVETMLYDNTHGAPVGTVRMRGEENIQVLSSDETVREQQQLTEMDALNVNFETFTAALVSGRLGHYESMYNGGKSDVGQKRNYTILREWDKQEDLMFKLNLSHAIEVVKSSVFKNAMKAKRRSLQEVFRGETSSNEVLMYVIEKHLNPAGATSYSERPFIQTIMISNSSPRNDSIRYVDTQVRYGVRYKYRIKQVRMIYGNKYSYDDIKFNFGNGYEQEGGAIAAALGFRDRSINRTAKYSEVQRALGNYLNARSNPEIPATEQNGYYTFLLDTQLVRSLERVRAYIVPDLAMSNIDISGWRGHSLFDAEQLYQDILDPEELTEGSQLAVGDRFRIAMINYARAIGRGETDLTGLTVGLAEGADGGMTPYRIIAPTALQNWILDPALQSVHQAATVVEAARAGGGDWSQSLLDRFEGLDLNNPILRNFDPMTFFNAALDITEMSPVVQETLRRGALSEQPYPNRQAHWVDNYLASIADHISARVELQGLEAVLQVVSQFNAFAYPGLGIWSPRTTSLDLGRAALVTSLITEILNRSPWTEEAVVSAGEAAELNAANPLEALLLGG